MNVNPMDLASSNLTDVRPERGPQGSGEPGLRPALFANYGDLTQLRYDYPLVLVEEEGDGYVQPLSAIVDAILQDVAPRGSAGERIRQHGLRLEQNIRERVSSGAGGALVRLWELAGADLLANAEQAERGSLSDSLGRIRDALHVDGQVVDCDEAAPAAIFAHAWTAVYRTKARAFRTKVDDLILKLSDILKADALKSDQGRTPARLKSSFGTSFEEAFDLQVMSGVLAMGSAGGPLPDVRRERIRRALSVLESQRFFGSEDAGRTPGLQGDPQSFVFDSCAGALAAFSTRLPEMAEVVKAVSVAELEIRNRYREAQHDAVFARFDESALGPGDLALFPGYLAIVREAGRNAAETAEILEILASGLPIKVLVQRDDLLGDSLAGAGGAAFGGGCELHPAFRFSSSAICRGGGTFSVRRSARYLDYHGRRHHLRCHLLQHQAGTFAIIGRRPQNAGQATCPREPPVMAS